MGSFLGHLLSCFNAANGFMAKRAQGTVGEAIDFEFIDHSFQNLSNCEDDPAEGAVLNQVTQSISRLGQRKGLSHDRFDRARLKQRTIAFQASAQAACG